MHFAHTLAAAKRWLHFPYDQVGRLPAVTAPNRSALSYIHDRPVPASWYVHCLVTWVRWPL